MSCSPSSSWLFLSSPRVRRGAAALAVLVLFIFGMQLESDLDSSLRAASPAGGTPAPPPTETSEQKTSETETEAPEPERLIAYRSVRSTSPAPAPSEPEPEPARTVPPQPSSPSPPPTRGTNGGSGGDGAGAFIKGEDGLPIVASRYFSMAAALTVEGVSVYLARKNAGGPTDIFGEFVNMTHFKERSNIYFDARFDKPSSFELAPLKASQRSRAVRVYGAGRLTNAKPYAVLANSVERSIRECIVDQSRADDRHWNEVTKAVIASINNGRLAVRVQYSGAAPKMSAARWCE